MASAECHEMRNPLALASAKLGAFRCKEITTAGRRSWLEDLRSLLVSDYSDASRLRERATVSPSHHESTAEQASRMLPNS